MLVTIYLCQTPCKKHFAIEDADPHPNWCPECPICHSADNVYEKAIGTLAVLKLLNQDEDDEPPKTCWQCSHRIGEECGVNGKEVFPDTESCEQFESNEEESA